MQALDRVAGTNRRILAAFQEIQNSILLVVEIMAMVMPVVLSVRPMSNIARGRLTQSDAMRSGPAITGVGLGLK
jgi:hypothetical protein